MNTSPAAVAEFRRPQRWLLALSALPLIGTSWALMWTQEAMWNPLFFVGTWMGATFLMYALGRGYPGWRAHLFLMGLSAPWWWWFELVNYRVENWEYVGRREYSQAEYFLLASVAFSTVIPALHSAWGLTVGRPEPAGADVEAWDARWFFAEAMGGVALLAAIFVIPRLFFPFVWVGPFLMVDGLVGRGGGRSLLLELVRGRWRLAAAVGAGGLLCGVLWEFWNFWATPKWVYHLPYLDFIDVFEMPILGYAGYIPFAWSVYQLLQVRPIRRALDTALRQT